MLIMGQGGEREFARGCALLEDVASSGNKVSYHQQNDDIDMDIDDGARKSAKNYIFMITSSLEEHGKPW